MKFDYNVIHEGVFYKTGSEVPVKETGTSDVKEDAENKKEENENSEKEEVTQEEQLTPEEQLTRSLNEVKRMNKSELLKKADELGLEVSEDEKNSVLKELISNKMKSLEES